MLDMPSRRGDVAGVYGSADIEMMLRAILDTPTMLADACPNDAMLQAYRAGVLAACRQLAMMTGAGIGPRTRRDAQEARARGDTW
jgi:hypothetical protein